MKVDEAFHFADNYFKFMCSYRRQTDEEVELHFVILDEYDGKFETAFIPPPDPNDSWHGMDKDDVRAAVVHSVSTIRPEYLLIATEAWVVTPATDAEFAAIMAYKRSRPNAPLSEYPGAKEILNLMVEGNGVLRTYISEIVNGNPIFPPEITDVDGPPDGMAGVFNGLWTEGMRLAMEGDNFN